MSANTQHNKSLDARLSVLSFKLYRKPPASTQPLGYFSVSLKFLLMMDAIISGLILLALSGLSWIAIKLPKTFARIYVSICNIATVAYIFYCGFYVGAGWMHSQLFRLLDSSRSAEASAISNNFDFWFPYVTIALFAFYGYILFLRFIPELIKQEQPQEPQEQNLITEKEKL